MEADSRLLLLACLQREGDLSGLQSATPEQWQALLDLAAFHRVLPLVYHRLVKEQFKVVLPKNVTEQLKAGYYKVAGQNLLLYRELGPILASLAADHIPVVLLKGSFLAQFVYQNIGLRSMADIDLLVPEADLMRCYQTLESLGLKRLNEFDLEIERSKLHHLPPVEKNGVTVEIHWKLNKIQGFPPLFLEALWQRAQTTHIEGSPCLALSPEDLLTHVCIHMAYSHDFYSQLRSLCDVSEIITHYSRFDWDRFVQDIQAVKAERGTWLILYLAGFYLGTAVPENVLKTLMPTDFKPEVITWTFDRLFSSSPVANRSFKRLFSEKKALGKVYFLWDALFPSRFEISYYYRIPQNSWKIWLYYPVNLLRKLRKFQTPLVKMAVGDRQMRHEVDDQVKLTKWLGQE